MPRKYNNILVSDISNFVKLRFLKKISTLIVSAEGCFLWESSLINGYGSYHFTFKSRVIKIYAHRLSYLLHKGDIPEGLVVGHSCDVRNCVNPSHLEVITDLENNKQRFCRNPFGNLKAKATKRAMSKISDIAIQEMKDMYFLGGCPQHVIAKEFGISQHSVWCFVNRINRTTKQEFVKTL